MAERQALTERLELLVCHLNDKERSASWQEMVRDWIAIVSIDDFALAQEYGEFAQAIKRLPTPHFFEANHVELQLQPILQRQGQQLQSPEQIPLVIAGPTSPWRCIRDGGAYRWPGACLGCEC